MKIVSRNCNGGFRKKYKELFGAYPDADLFMVQECENPDFYNSQEYKTLFLKGFHVGTPDYSMKVPNVSMDINCTCWVMLSSR